jgi:hypothetical protein
MASLVQTTAFLTTEAEARALCAATGTDLGGVGSYQNKGACKKKFPPTCLHLLKLLTNILLLPPSLFGSPVAVRVLRRCFGSLVHFAIHFPTHRHVRQWQVRRQALL